MVQRREKVASGQLRQAFVSLNKGEQWSQVLQKKKLSPERSCRFSLAIMEDLSKRNVRVFIRGDNIIKKVEELRDG